MQVRLGSVWKTIVSRYELSTYIGAGSFGQVIKARCMQTGKLVAIKHISNIFRNSYECRKVIREISILRQLSEMEDNLFTPKLVDIIIPSQKTQHGYGNFDDIFIIMEYFDQNLSCVFTRVKNNSFTEQHVITIMYNFLCAMNFLHTANVMHRDLKPQNILLTSQCSVYICDFGLARTKPATVASEDDLFNTIEMKQQLVGSSVDQTMASTDIAAAQLDNQVIDQQNARISRREQFLSEKYEQKGQITEQSRQTKRNLTREVQTRVYRAPEVILTCRNYDEKIDCWSMGCILGELLTLTPAYARMQAHIQAQNNNNYRFIFQGDSCYPISPCVEINSAQTPNHEKCYSSDDQIAKIIRKLGYLGGNDKNFIEAKSKLEYLEYFQNYVESTREENYESTLTEQFQDSPQEVVELLLKLLSFSPTNRVSAADCLQNKIFDSVRCKNLQNPAKKQIIVDIDDDGSFDYDTGLDFLSQKSNYLRDKIINEVRLFEEWQNKMKF